MENNIKNILNHSEVSEKAIEKYLVDSVEKLGGICLKYSNSNMTGYPDRLVMLPYGKLLWLELKSKGKQPSKVQKIRFRQMDKIGFPVFIADSKAQIDLILKTAAQL